jgi:guanylate kinase
MITTTNKKIVCITGSLWTHKHDAPRHLLVKEGFIRPRWFSTGRTFNDANYEFISETSFHLAQAESKVLAHLEYGGVVVGIMMDKFQQALEEAPVGVLVVGFPEIIAQIADNYSQAIVFAFKPEGAELSEYLETARKMRQLHRIDIDVLEIGAWDEVMDKIQTIVGY